MLFLIGFAMLFYMLAEAIDESGLLWSGLSILFMLLLPVPFFIDQGILFIALCVKHGTNRKRTSSGKIIK